MSELRRWFERVTHPVVRASFAAVAGLAATWFYASVVDPVYPIDQWLFWTLLAIWSWVGVFNLACFCFGQFVLRRVLRLRALPPLEASVHGMAIGIVCFVLFMYAAGALALYGPLFALLLPAAMIAAGATDGFALASEFYAELRQARPRGLLLRFVAGFGILCTGLIYLGVMTPDVLNYDASWYHVVAPQEYARQGRLIAFPGNYNMAVPQLHGMVHTWGFCVPGLDMPRRWMLLLHNEFIVFVWTLAGVAAGVRRLLDDQSVRGAWTAMFLFPIIAVYDHNMGGAGDHFAAFFAVPMLLALFELCRTFSASSAALFAFACAGCILSKYQAVYLIAPMGAVLGVAWALRLFSVLHKTPAGNPARAPALRPLIRAPLIVLGLGTLLVSPHFLKNVVFYGNPVYPFATQLFSSSWPVMPNGHQLIAHIFTDDNWKPKGSALEKTKHALELVLNFSWKPHYSFTKNFPAFGSLFTLTLPLLLAIRRPQRIALGALIGLGALFAWAYTYNVDRNLQLFLPVLAAVTAALIVGAYRLGPIARVGLVPLVAFQLVWGGDAFFYSAYDRIQSSMQLIKSGFDGNAATRFDGYRSNFRAIGQALPKNARVLLHASHPSLGIDREIIQDWVGFQGFIAYDALRTPREFYDLLRNRGITHILYAPRERPASSKQEEVLFYAFVTRYGVPVGTFGGHRLLSVPDSPPPLEKPYRVGVLGVARYENGIYPIERLNTIEYLPAREQRFSPPERAFASNEAELLALDAVIVGPGSRVPEWASAALRQRFTISVDFSGNYTVYLKKPE